MKLLRIVLILLGLALMVFGFTVLANAQTDPCTAPTPTGVLNPTTIAMNLPEYTTKEIDQSFRIQSVSVGFYLQGVDPSTGSPVQTVTLPRTALALAPGTLNCYTAPLPSIPINAGSAYVAHVKAVGPSGESAWSMPSNPFSVGAAPAQIPRVVIIRSI